MSSLYNQLYRFRSEIRRVSSVSATKINLVGLWKYFFRWNSDQRPGRSSMKDMQPWITYSVIHFLEKYLKPEMKVFEYGGGGSTLFFLNRIGVRELVTVEHHKEWFENISKEISARHINNWKGILLEPEKNNTKGSASDPHAYLSADPASANLEFRKYASAIDSYSPEYFDLVMVDGRARPSCLMHAMPRVKKGGLLILDNSERSYYLEKLNDELKRNFELMMDPFGPVPYGSSFSKTSVWRKK